MRPVCYLASPIDRASNAVGLPGMQAKAVEMLTNTGFTVYNPAGAWSVPPELRSLADPLPRAIGNVDFLALDSSQALLAILPDHVHTLGVPMEIERALGLGIPVAIVGGEIAQRSPLLAGRVYNSLETAYEAKLFDSVGWLGTKAIDNEAATTLYSTGIGFEPSKAYPDDAGYDLYANVDVTLHPGQFCDIPTGIAVQLPPGYGARITGRSSTFRKRRLLVLEGIIDNGFRGELFAPVLNMGAEPQEVQMGERLAQLIPFRCYDFKVQHVEALSPSQRGENGFGSSGK